MVAKVGYLYCMSAGQYIKIGFTTNPYKRLREIRCGKDGTSKYPEVIDLGSVMLECYVPAYNTQEREFHKQFQHECIDGTREWYPLGGQAHTAFLMMD